MTWMCINCDLCLIYDSPTAVAAVVFPSQRPVRDSVRTFEDTDSQEEKKEWTVRVGVQSFTFTWVFNLMTLYARDCQDFVIFLREGY